MPGKIKKLEMVNIRKEFPGVLANDDVSFTVEAGEILGLLGENGAGKSTLMNILYGLYSPDKGEIRINDVPVPISSPRDALKWGIGMVHQHFMLISTHTVAENLALAFPDMPVFSPTAPALKKLDEFAEKYGLKINPDAYIWELSAGEQQRVEIVKALLGGADVLVLDEPTSVLTPMEADELFGILRKMVQDGHAIIFITHKLEEIMRTAKRIVVLRQGKLAGQADVSKSAKEDLARMMVGREILFHLERNKVEPGPIVMELENVSVKNAMGRLGVKNLSFSLRRGEILGIAGVAGNGQRELVEAIAGLRRAEEGSIRLLDREMTLASPRWAAENGISHVPEDRIKSGVVGTLSLVENCVLKDYYQNPFCGRFFLNYSEIRRRAERIVKDFSVSCPSPDTPIKNLSGGNIQKFLIGRELDSNPQVLIASHPTYGVDIGAAEFIRKKLLLKREEGGAILLVSEDLEEILELSDRIAVIFRGEFMGIMPREQANTSRIGLMMTGAKEGADTPGKLSGASVR